MFIDDEAKIVSEGDTIIIPPGVKQRIEKTLEILTSYFFASSNRRGKRAGKMLVCLFSMRIPLHTILSAHLTHTINYKIITYSQQYTIY